MNPAPVYAISIFRSLVIAALAIMAAYAVCGALVTLRVGWRRRAAWCLLLAPFLTPALVVGYAYSAFSLTLVRHPLLNEAFYVLLMTARLGPVATAILYFAPPPAITPHALWCARLAKGEGRRAKSEERRANWNPLGSSGLRAFVHLASSFVALLRSLSRLGRGRFVASPVALRSSLFALYLRGPAGAGAVAFAVVFVVAFGEFEIASLVNVRTWGVWLFDAQAGGLALSNSLQYAIAPLLCELVVLVPALALVCHWRRLPAPPDPRRLAVRRPVRALAWSYLLVGVGVAVVLPAMEVLNGTGAGLRVLWGHFTVHREIGASLVFALSASGMVFFLCHGPFVAAPSQPEGGSMKVVAMALLCVPGLLGSLLLSLVVLGVVQLPLLRPLRDGPLPLLVVLVFLLFPMAFLLLALVRGLAGNTAIHAARQVRASSARRLRSAGGRLLWDLQGRAEFYVFFVLFLWAYFDLCSGVLLRPAQMPLAPDLLYNQMHYGQSAVLSATLCVVVLVPVLLFGLGVALRAAYESWAAHG